jgi:DNA primase large subunit
MKRQSSKGVERLRQNRMMKHLLEALEGGSDIGHYGRLVFAMVARHFIEEDELVAWLARDPAFDEGRARSLVDQVKRRDYSPPNRERITAWQKQQDFPICPHIDDPDEANVYRDLAFPEEVYERIEAYHEQKADAGADA